MKLSMWWFNRHLLHAGYAKPIGTLKKKKSMQPAPEKLRQIGLRVEWRTAGEGRKKAERNRKKEGVWAVGGEEEEEKKHRKKRHREPRSSYAGAGWKEEKTGRQQKNSKPSAQTWHILSQLHLGRGHM